MGNPTLELTRSVADELKRDEAINQLLRNQLYIDGIEVTQSIQYYHAKEHLTDSNDWGADNTVRLVAGKPAWVRVYVRSLFTDKPGVTGKLDVYRRTNLIHGEQFVETLKPIRTGPNSPIVPALLPASITAYASTTYDAERSDLTRSLNFYIPSEDMIGVLRLHATVTYGSVTVEQDVTVSVLLQQTLRVAGILIGYNGSNGAAVNPTNITLASPTLGNLRTTAAFSLAVMPVQAQATFRAAGTMTQTQPLTDAQNPPGGCSTNWNAMLTAVQAIKTNDGNRTDVLYYGLLAAGVPRGPVIGCENGVSVGADTDGVTMSHELTHQLGLAHAPCGNVGTGSKLDANYPAYEPYDAKNTPNASIGEYGLNINNGAVLSPATTKDYMSYCGPQWIGLYTIGQLTENSLLDPTTVGNDDPWWKWWVTQNPFRIPQKDLPDPPPPPEWLGWQTRAAQPEQVISIIGIVQSEIELEVHSVSRVQVFTQLPRAAQTELTAELIGHDGKVLGAAPVMALESIGGCGGGCRCGGHGGKPQTPHLFQVFLANPAHGAALRIRRGEKHLWEKRATAKPPRVARFEARLRERHILFLEWEAECEERHDAWLQYSPDDGATWFGATTGLAERETEFDASYLPTGKLLLRLLVHDGFHTRMSAEVPVEIPARPPTVSVFHPQSNSYVAAGGPMRLWGAATASTGEPVAPHAVRWLLDGEEAGRGCDFLTTAPEAGRHRLTMLVESAAGEAEHSIHFETQSEYREEK